jgi:hypothetical protein
LIEVEPCILFYGHFIDDVFEVVEADSAEEALAIAQSLKIDGVEIKWSVSKWSTPFLDLLVFIDPVTRTIEHKPFCKALNHLEHIPWASHHPKDVKKGTFIGEMSRLAVLSSRPQFYLDACHELGLMYIARRYPVDLVTHWLKEYSALRWRMQLGEPKAVDEVLALKSVYNQAWEKFNVHDLQQTVVSTWA